jgi:hypothetical protein
MSTTIRRAAVTAAVLASAAGAAGLAPASADEARDPSRISVHASDYDVSSGEQFVLRGRMWSGGDPVAGARVRVQFATEDGWENVRGAVVETGSDGRYRVRVILSRTGDRRLRVVGNPDENWIRTSFGHTTVEVP